MISHLLSGKNSIISCSLTQVHVLLRRFKVLPDENIPSYASPFPRYAHSFVCDSLRQCFYLFGGNPGSSGAVGTHAKATSNMRLDDLWRLQVRPFHDCTNSLTVVSVLCS